MLLAALALLTSIAVAEDQTDWAGAAFGADITGPTRGGIVSADDLLRLRDLGGLSVAPDGRHLAFSVRQAVPERNEYVLRWFVMSTTAGSAPQVLAMNGGAPIPEYKDGVPTAYVPPEAVKWSADAERIAFRRRIDQRIELWAVHIGSGRITRVWDGSSQVTAFAWTRRGELVFRTGLNYDRYKHNLEDEARNGWLLDGRAFLSGAIVWPTPSACAGADFDGACDVRTLVAHPDRPAEIRESTPDESKLLDADKSRSEPRADGAVVRTEIADPSVPAGFRPIKRIATDAAGAGICAAQPCIGRAIKQFGWARGGHSVWFRKAESSLGRPDGAPLDETALYEWRPGSRAVRQIHRTEDLIEDCNVNGAVAYCMRESPTRPRHVIAIDLDSGRVRVMADPNGAFVTKSYPRVRKIVIHDSEGNPGVAQIIHPYDYRPGKLYPLVVTQYMEYGFVRGQVGNEYPAFPLAAEGFMVLSVTLPWDWERQHHLSLIDYEISRASGLRDWRRRFSALQSAVDRLIADGLVDERRVAITGLSAGAENVHFALQRTNRFAAAIASSAMQDLTFLALISEGPRRERLMKMWGSDQVVAPEGNPIRELSWAFKPERLTTPLLINVGQYEAMIGFEGIQALKHAGRPVEVRVFPDERHIKYHPRSYAGVFENNILWLKFWLMDIEDPRPQYAQQYARWRKLRAQHRAESNR